jgi:UDP-glucose 4-epimerase
VTECVDGFMHGFKAAGDQLNVFNLGVDSTTKVTRIAEILVEEMGLENVDFKYTGGTRGWKGDVPHFQFDISKIKNIGWQPKHSSDEAVRKAIKDLLKTL